MPSGQKDSSPNMGDRKGVGRKNNDLREKGSEYDRQANGAGDGGPGMPGRKASLQAKEVGVTPNEDVKKLNGGRDREGLEEGAY